jgi:hypothetical protein
MAINEYQRFVPTMQTPSNMEVFLHCHYSREEHPRAHAPAVRDALVYLEHQGMIERRKDQGDDSQPMYKTTARGQFYLEHILNVPFPVEVNTYAIPPTQLD